MRALPLLLAGLLALALPCAAAAQTLRGGLVGYARDGGRTELMEHRFAVHGGYTVEATAPTGVYVGARYILGAHWFRPDTAAYAARYGPGTVEGGGGTLYDTGVDVELGAKLGPVRPYLYTGYHYLRQFEEPATVAGGGAGVELDSRTRQSFSRARGYGVVLLLGPGGVFAERFRGGGEGGVVRLSGTRVGLRYAW